MEQNIEWEAISFDIEGENLVIILWCKRGVLRQLKFPVAFLLVYADLMRVMIDALKEE